MVSAFKAIKEVLALTVEVWKENLGTRLLKLALRLQPPSPEYVQLLRDVRRYANARTESGLKELAEIRAQRHT